MQLRLIIICATFSLALFVPPEAAAHFGLLLPSDDIVESSEGKTITLKVKFLHPMEGSLMDMEQPVRLGVLNRGKTTNLLKAFTETREGGMRGWTGSHTVNRPGDHLFFMEPAPYWEPIEETFIVHYTKVVVSGLGMEVGWDEPVGLPVEILPLTRPYGLWAGNVFQGVVTVEGAPHPFAEVEVEYLNLDGVKIPAPPYVTQLVKADGNGVFTYAMPRAGWWGFAALTEGPETMEREGKTYPVERGAVLWVRTRTMESDR